MKKTIRKLLCLLLTVCFLLTGFSSLAAENTGYEKKYDDYGSYVLLGDSVASGWSDIEERETRFVRVEGSYGAFVADDLGVTYHPMACIGFRTTDLRYIFEDDYEADRFLFYSISDEEMERRIPEIRKAVSEAGLITLNVGGNDWGSFVGWHVFEEMDKAEVRNEAFLTKAKAYLEEAGTDPAKITELIDIANLCGALPQLISILPQALLTGFENFFANWNHVIEDIYALNPDVTLVVIGMFDNMVQDQETADKNEAALIKLSLSQAIVDYANTPMREGAEKYGYIFIDPVGTVCEQNHPSTAGHRFIADKILEALPDMNFPYTDVDKSSAEYKDIEYLYQNGYMDGVSLTEFAPGENLTKAQLKSTLNKITGKSDEISVEDTEKTVSRLDMAKSVLSAASGKGLKSYIKAFFLAIDIILDTGITGMGSTVTRGEAAVIFRKVINL
ncbi:MAG: S-layer homology domain-containing protein [Clostridia bacterium]|nr:S-layer homology domain-containing protein [Clostridia bacterium]